MKNSRGFFDTVIILPKVKYCKKYRYKHIKCNYESEHGDSAKVIASRLLPMP